jgi:acyl-CoA thioesterase FadM
MSRKEIVLPDQFDFSCDFRVRFDDLNGHHLGQDSITAAAIDAQRRMFLAMGFDLATLGYTTVYSEAAFLAEAAFNDQIRIEVALPEAKGKSFKTWLRFYNETRGREAARMVNTHLYIDLDQGRVAPVPREFQERVKRFRSA